MKTFLAFVLKEFQHVWRDKRSLFILIAMPVMLMFIFGFALSNEVKNSNIAILCPKPDEEVLSLIEKIDQSKYFTINKMMHNPNEIENYFKQNKGKMVIVFENDFADKLQHDKLANVQLIGDATDPNTATTMIGYAQGIIADYQKSLLGETNLPYAIQVETRMLYNPQLLSAYNFVPGVMALILTLLGTMMTSVSIVKEKEFGSMELLLVSPVKPIMVIFSKALPYALLCFIDVLIILLMARYVLDMPIRGNIFLLLAMSVLFIFTTLSLGLLISNSVDQQQVAMFISLVGLMMPSLIFSGFMFPIENMPKPMQIISNIVPTKWYFEILKSVMVKGLGFSYIWKHTLILVGMTAFFTLVAVRKFKIRLS
ncbi:MAG TPA: ABC transporter permease [Saprospiraceae bacterium]|nr:ABC transporter permease [Saprospiraceae bacterium]HPN69001.1 ABC transporter permease [Saprospiraceae bacterium]